MLSIKNISVEVDKKMILDTISMDFDLGKNYCLIGKNGSGKSSLAMVIMGHPKYQITNGELRITNGKNESTTGNMQPATGNIDLKKLNPHERAKLGIFVAFQHIPEIKGIKLFEFLRSIYDAQNETTTSFLAFKNIIKPLMDELTINTEFLRRDLNVGFSGGERRKIEILQLKLLKPTYIFLDEIDSGLDVDAFKSVVEMMAKLNHEKNSFIIITHIFDILKYIPVDHVYVLEQGKIIKEGDQKLIEVIKKEGFIDIEKK
ncbi:MAG: Fe-S cluster assembly ATPase SufC [Candidatus Absconditabacterales bacterium]